ncbi:GNAT family N-acetyltransferase [Aquiflexum sp. TKW24L]|uniref:GNAT family N-acetyltransferase n=1 Tax=Aquiflexum sp. TKW24L TaxID=2942212 RepID=UPI0020BD8B22|nr:GNAT family N-acetyltransferase [Aquiflexum sp. TKW24L]MCL6258351.1 GNAT family N-acetyltransferase [Aquiflexum sp. TKW24L]
MSLIFKTAETYEEFVGILDLQQENHIKNLDSLDQGFVFAEHSVEDLWKMSSYAPHIIAKDDEYVAAYILAMTVDCKEDIEMLIPMFEEFDQLEYKGVPLSEYNYLVVGQVAVDKGYRGQGIFDQCYELYREVHGDNFDFAITEISERNYRSLAAHYRVGFRELSRYPNADGEEWIIVVWDWME